jgi:hypothetical protein
MTKEISQTGKFGYFSITFEVNSEIAKYYKDGGGECWHDVPFQVVEVWADLQGRGADDDLVDFIEKKVSTGLAQNFISFIEANTTPSSTWMSMGDIEGMGLGG